ncbi:MAG TPA: hypothetical protein VNJ11_16510 [Bryobacteraceae bacterium]|nr:hypothetical protein [Bryobacteraceae bacterium]
MKKPNAEPVSAVGLDVGTSRIVVAERDGSEICYRSDLNAFVAVPFTRMTERSLRKERIPHLVRDGRIFIYGREADKFADLFHLETRRPMRGGLLNSAEPESLTLIGQIVRALTDGAERDRQKLCLSVPAPPLGAEDSATYHEAALRQLLAEMGYDVITINEGLAVIYAELEENNYTGIGISFGGGLCNVCLAYLSAPLFCFSVPKAGDFIDASAAAVTGELATRVRILKETSFHFNGSFTGQVQQALSVYYQEMIQAVIAGLQNAFADARNVPKLGRPLPVVLSGGSALPAGFLERFERQLREASLPVSLAEVRLAAEPLNSTAKGALVAALAEL